MKKQFIDAIHDRSLTDLMQTEKASVNGRFFSHFTLSFHVSTPCHDGFHFLCRRKSFPVSMSLYDQ